MSEALRVGGVFSGLGGIELGLERAGMSVVWLCESDPYRRSVLRRHWAVPCYPDVRGIGSRYRPAAIDLLCGGFPCEDISRVGRRTGIDGPKSGLWAEFYRLVCDLRPSYVLLENSTSLRNHGLDRITGQLAQIGYDAEWECLPAAAFGAPHIRDRIYLLAYPRSRRHGSPEATVFAGWTSSQLHVGWAHEPALARVADGPSYRMERSALGDAAVPAISEWIGRRILNVV